MEFAYAVVEPIELLAVQLVNNPTNISRMLILRGMTINNLTLVIPLNILVSGTGYAPQQHPDAGYPTQQQQPGAGYPSQQPEAGYPPQQQLVIPLNNNLALVIPLNNNLALVIPHNNNLALVIPLNNNLVLVILPNNNLVLVILPRSCNLVLLIHLNNSLALVILPLNNNIKVIRLPTLEQKMRHLLPTIFQSKCLKTLGLSLTFNFEITN